jgi:hypothetical protein
MLLKDRRLKFDGQAPFVVIVVMVKMVKIDSGNAVIAHYI